MKILISISQVIVLMIMINDNEKTLNNSENDHSENVYLCHKNSNFDVFAQLYNIYSKSF